MTLITDAAIGTVEFETPHNMLPEAASLARRWGMARYFAVDNTIAELQRPLLEERYRNAATEEERAEIAELQDSTFGYQGLWEDWRSASDALGNGYRNDPDGFFAAKGGLRNEREALYAKALAAITRRDLEAYFDHFKFLAEPRRQLLAVWDSEEFQLEHRRAVKRWRGEPLTAHDRLNPGERIVRSEDFANQAAHDRPESYGTTYFVEGPNGSYMLTEETYPSDFLSGAGDDIRAGTYWR